MNDSAAPVFDVAIAGGGMVGASLALALADSAVSVVMIEASPPDEGPSASFDDRTTALGNGARRIFQTLGVWQDIAREAAPIREIHVSDAGRFGFARLRAAEHDLDAFGYTVTNRHLGKVLWRALRERSRVQLRAPARVQAALMNEQVARLTLDDGVALSARLVIAADGAHSLVKQAAGIPSDARDYQQVAVVAVVRTNRASQGVAYERFTDSGPLALLPRFDNSHAVIWTLPPQSAPQYVACDAGEFCRRLQQRFGWRAGHIVSVGARASYPLSLVQARSSVGTRVALIGNAAQTLHPVAAQGFNLGLRDAAVLAELITAASDPGAAEVLQAYERHRASDRRGMIRFTDRLVGVFGQRSALAGAARDLALLLFDLSPTAKQALSRLSWGFGPLPRLARGLPLSGRGRAAPER